MENNCSKILNECNVLMKKKILDIFIENEDKFDYNLIDLNDSNKSKLTNKLKELEDKFYRKEKYNLINKLFDDCENENNNIIKEFLDYCFESQNTNKLLIVIFFSYKKNSEIKLEKIFENNYNIYLERQNFEKELKIILKEIKSYKQLFEYIGNDFLDNKSIMPDLLLNKNKQRFKEVFKQDL